MLNTKDNFITHIKKHKHIYILASLVIVFNIKVFYELILDWYNDNNYSHGFFIIPISIYLFYKKRDAITFPAKPDNWGIFFFVSGCVGLIFGVAASEYFTTRFAIVMILSSMTLYYLGRENYKKVWFCFFFLLFMIPIPATIYYSATLPMQLFSSKVTVMLLNTLGVPVLRDGNIIHLPGYALEVAEACSGLRSLVTLMALGALYAYTKMPGRILPILLFLAAIPIAIATNIFRIFTAAIGAYAVSKEIAENFLHEISGIMVFVAALILMLILGNIMVWVRNRFQSS